MKNRQKHAQKPHIWAAKSVKMGKFGLQKPNMTILARKMMLLFVNFLQRRFVRHVNLPSFWVCWRDFFEILFLDINGKLCYYIIYIWENSAQNRPFGRVCLIRWRECISWSRPLRVRARWRNPTAKVFCEHLSGSKRKNQRAKKC